MASGSAPVVLLSCATRATRSGWCQFVITICSAINTTTHTSSASPSQWLREYNTEMLPIEKRNVGRKLKATLSNTCSYDREYRVTRRVSVPAKFERKKAWLWPAKLL